jgi:hypothetical protein
MRTAPVTRLRTLAKITLLFFAVLFTAVLIHPDLDLLDVHDVKITNARTQLGSVDRQVVQQLILQCAGLPLSRGPLWESLLFVDEGGSTHDPGASRILRI